METMECIMGRTCIRKFRKDDIKDVVMDRILSAGTAAPSARNCQDWEFVVVRKPEGRQRLMEACMGQEKVGQAPVVVVVCSNLKKISRLGIRGETFFTIQDTAAATQNIMLAAWSEGIGSCWVGGFNEDKVRQALVLPEHVKPVAVIPMGYPDEKPEKPARWPLKECVHREHF